MRAFKQIIAHSVAVCMLSACAALPTRSASIPVAATPTVTITSKANLPLLSREQAADLAYSRDDDFLNALNLTIDVQSPTIRESLVPLLKRMYQHVWVTVTVTFANTSDRVIAFKAPKFISLDNRTDLDLHFDFWSSKGELQFWGGIFVDGPRVANESDFVFLEPGETYQLVNPARIPDYVSDDGKELIVLPPGIYLVSAVYRNRFIGYDYNPDQPHPTEQSNWSDWYDGTKVVDLNAWVGEIGSNRVEFNMPDISQGPAGLRAWSFTHH